MTEPYTAADVQLVAEAIRETDCDSSSAAARAILSALAEAGRLVPDGAEQRRVEVLQIWYRSIQADGSVWCESSNGPEVARLSAGIATKFERLVITKITGTWEPWEPRVEADEDSTR